MSRLHAIQPADVPFWAARFLAYATECDADGFPLRGSFGVGYNCNIPLSADTPVADIAREIETNNPTYTPNQIRIKSQLLYGCFTALKQGTVVALKKGLTVIAFARIVSPYRYDPAHADALTTHPHRWDYEVIRKATVSEERDYTGNYCQTFVANSVPLPADLVEPEPAPAPAPEPIPEAAPAPEPVPEPAPAPAPTREDIRRARERLAELRAAAAAARAAEKAAKAARAALRATAAAAAAEKAAVRAEKAAAKATKKA